MDFASSYPFELIARKQPMSPWRETRDMRPDEILAEADNFAYFFLFEAAGVQLKEGVVVPMPPLQYSKLVQGVNIADDNGRVLSADYASLWITEHDLDLIMRYYEFSESPVCSNVHVCRKAYLPKWFRDYVFECYADKCRYKHGDRIIYNIKKSTVNSIYGMCVQKPSKEDIVENYATGEYTQGGDLKEKYEMHAQRKTSILPYSWGVWCTAGAMHSLYDLGECVTRESPDGTGGIWLYSDTDSVYGIYWDNEKLDALNARRRQMLTEAGYGPVEVDGEAYWLGAAEHDKTCSQFVTLGAKRYAYEDDKGVHITVAGVPKAKGAECLEGNIRKFAAGFVFPGEKTGKLTHNYLYSDIHTTEAGDIAADSIDLTPCDYLLDSTDWFDLEDVFTEKVYMAVYDDF